MYKIYINETPLILAKLESMDKIPEATPTKLVAQYLGMNKTLLNYSDMLEKSRRYESVHLFAKDYEQLVRDFMNHFKVIEAAGGLVFNSQNEILAIYRRGCWDLPKGKIDPGETPPIAAIREVQEETGIQHLVLGDPLTSTYHTYRQKERKRILKKTYWYKMKTSDTETNPQIEEDIEKAIWIDPKTFLSDCDPMYKTIRNVVEEGS